MGRRKGSSAFPVARIKKMMQADDEVGKIATVTPVLVAKALECMMEHVLTEAADVARRRHTKTVTPQHLHFCVAHNDHFDFLRPTLAHVAPLDDHPGAARHPAPVRRARPKRPRSPVPPPLVRELPAEEAADVGVSAMPCTAPRAPSVEVPAPGKRHKLRGAAPAAVTAAQLPGVGKVADPAGEEEEDNYDDDDDDDDGAQAAAREAPGLPALHGLPAAAQHAAIGDPDDSKASERVSVHALLS